MHFSCSRDAPSPSAYVATSSLASDKVFSDGATHQVVGISGRVSAGYVAELTVGL